MPNIIMFKDFLTATVDSQSSEQTDWEAVNILNPDRQLDFWRTIGTGDGWVILDLGSAQALTSLALINVNYTSVIIEGNSTTNFTSPASTSGTLTIPQDLARGRYYLHTDPSTYGTAFNHRYLRIFIPTQSVTDAASEFKTGGIVLKTGSNTILINPNQGLNMQMSVGSDIVEMRSGRREVRNTSIRLASLAMDFERDVRIEAQVDELHNLLATTDEQEMIFFYDNASFLTKPTNSPHLYVFRQNGLPNMSYTTYSGFEVSGVNLLEQI